MVTAVLGLQWGDEGKGKIVDVLCEQADLVVRCQGGANAGHTVVIEGQKHVLHLVPSGILTEGIRCVIGDGVVIDLEVLEREIEHLVSAGIDVWNRLAVSKRAHVVLPLHKRLERLHEEARGKSRIGTTGRGIGPCYGDKATRLGIRFGDILDRNLDEKLRLLCRVHDLGDEDLSAEAMLAYLERFGEMVNRIAADTHSILFDAMDKNRRILLEGSQGFLLDIDHGTYPYVTSCNTGIHGLLSGSGIPPSRVVRVIGVAKAYVTRVGAGPMPTEMEEPFQGQIRQRGAEYGATTGRPRRCGWLDLVALRYACRANGVTSLAITKLDTLAGIETLKVCTAYDFNGQTLTSPPAETEVLARCVPGYEVVKPWDRLEEVGSIDDLPSEARTYLEMITDWTQTPIELVSIGPERKRILRA